MGSTQSTWESVIVSPSVKVKQRSLMMNTKFLVLTVFVCCIVGCYAPFPRNDPRSILNPLIEPWWCKVPTIMREVLHFKFLKTPLNERGGCSIVPSAEPEPESEPEYEPAPEPEG